MRNLVILLFIFTFHCVAQDTSGNAVVFNASPTGSASDIIFLQGSGFGTSPHIQYSFNDSTWTTLTPVSSGNETALVQLPAASRLPDLLAIEVSPDGSHWSAPVFINQAQANSLDTDRIASGSRFRTFGRNLIFSRTPTVRLVDTVGGASYSATIDTAASTPYALVAIAPAGIQASHTYAVYVSNGYTGNATTGGEVLAPATLQGIAAGNDYFNLGVSWANELTFTGNVYNVQTDNRLVNHARSDGSPTDQIAIQEAIGKASNDGGGIVYLPAGTYNFYFQNGCGITLFSHVVVMGQGASNTFLNYGFGSAPSPGTGYAVCFAPTQSGLSDVTVTNVNQSGHWPESAVANGVNEMFIQRTNWNISTARWIVMENSTSSTMQNSTLTQGLDTSYNGPFNGAGTTNLLLRNNTIKYVAGGILLNNVNNGILENNTIIRDAAQRVAGQITHVLVANFTRNFMLLHNTFQVSGATLPLTNDGETINSEAGGSTRYDEFRGTVQSAGANSLTDSAQNFNWSSNNAIPNLRVGAIIAIVAGKGAGQWSPISAVSPDGHTISVSKPWAVPPANGSRYTTFDWSAANWIIAANSMSDNEKGIEFFDCSLRDVLITGNQLTNNSQILISPTQEPTGAGIFNFVLNTQITSNTLTDTNHLRPAAISIVPREDFQSNNFGIAAIGTEIRGNSITGFTPNTITSPTSLDDSIARAEGINLYWQWQTLWSNFIDDGTPSILGSVIAGNNLTNSAAPYEFDSGTYETALYSNSTNNVGATADWALPGVTHSSIDTVSVTTTGSAAPGPRTAPPPAAPSASNVWNQLTVGTLAASTLAGQPASTTSFTLAPSLYQLGVGPDSLSMLAQQLTSATSISARVTVPSQASAASEGMVTFRNYTAPLSAFVSFGQLQNGQLFFEYRPYFGGAVNSWTMPHALSPAWVKLTKSGNLFQATFSDDGTSWDYAVSIGASFGSESGYVALESLSDAISGPAVLFDGVTAL